LRQHGKPVIAIPQAFMIEPCWSCALELISSPQVGEETNGYIQ
jgi:hypothetical protein